MSTPRLEQLYAYRDMLREAGIPCAMIGSHSTRQRIWLWLQLAIDYIAQGTGRPHMQCAMAIVWRSHAFLRGARGGHCTSAKVTHKELLAPLMGVGEVVVRCPKCGQGFTEEALGLDVVGADGVAGCKAGSKSPHKSPHSTDSLRSSPPSTGRASKSAKKVAARSPHPPARGA